MRSSMLALVILAALLPCAPAAARPAETGTHRKKKAPRLPRQARCRDAFCTTQVMKLDGASGGGDAHTLTEEQVERTVSAHRRRMEGCLVDARRRDPKLRLVRVEFVVTGKGRVIASRVQGKRGSPLARCIHKELRGVHFPTFALARTVAAVTLSVPQ